MAYWELADLEARISSAIVVALFDEDLDGQVDEAPIAMLQADCDSYVEGALRPVYDLDAVRLAPPHEVKRLSLDCAVMYCAQRHPKYMNRDWERLKASLDKDLDAIRVGKRRLDVVGTPEPGANNGGTVVPGRDDETEAPRMWDWGGTGDF